MILVIGEIAVKDNDLKLYAKKHFNMSEDDLILVTDYSKVKDFNFGSLFHNSNITDVIISQMPHSAGKSGHYSNVIQKMENEPGYPNIIRASRTMKLSISGFKNAVNNSVWLKTKLTSNSK